MKVLDAKGRAVFENERGVVTLSNRRPTDCKGNFRTYLLEARPIREEVEMVLGEEAWKEEVDKFMRENCRDDV